MAFKVRPPSIFYGRLESCYEHSFGAQPSYKLIRGEGFTEAHFCVPKESWNCVHVFCPSRHEVGMCSVHRFSLLITHRKGLIMAAAERCTSPQLGEDGLHIAYSAAHPFQFGVHKTLLFKRDTYLPVGKHGSVVPNCSFVQLNAIILDSSSFELLSNALFHLSNRCPILSNPACPLSAIEYA